MPPDATFSPDADNHVDLMVAAGGGVEHLVAFGADGEVMFVEAPRDDARREDLRRFARRFLTQICARRLGRGLIWVRVSWRAHRHAQKKNDQEHDGQETADQGDSS